MVRCVKESRREKRMEDQKRVWGRNKTHSGRNSEGQAAEGRPAAAVATREQSGLRCLAWVWTGVPGCESLGGCSRRAKTLVSMISEMTVYGTGGP
jgi:hypothetical protein